MPLQRNEKVEVVDRFAELLASSEAVVIADYRGMNVAQLRKLRRRLRDHNAEFQVIKNTLATLAFERAGLMMPAEMLVGPTAVCILRDELSAPAKILLETADETNLLVVKGGLMQGRALDAEGVKTLSRLPSRPELLAQLLGVLIAPQRQMVTVLNAPIAGLVRVMRAYSEKDAA